MQVIKILTWALRIAFFIIILVLALDNIQSVTFNVFGIYYIHLPLFGLVLLFLALGVLLGLLIGLFKTVELKSKLNSLQKKYDKLNPNTPNNN